VHKKILSDIQRESDNLEDLGVDRRIISRITLKKSVEWSGEDSFASEYRPRKSSFE
jgi:hypothetical protein